MEGIGERYEKSLRQRAEEKLEEARAEFCTKIVAAINEAKIYESGADRDDKEIRREQ